ncbi:hypothetical protein VitviT2T_003058 [Vitis vinifera]|uniref:Uncharacterized protein n=1 Tax=Vitis vinifera TaxID=29760 RepID=A0ABY9BKC8_VITVI|nr:hypothetical protein VitviT2T_003058 [Vitis vinifera]
MHGSWIEDERVVCSLIFNALLKLKNQDVICFNLIGVGVWSVPYFSCPNRSYSGCSVLHFLELLQTCDSIVEH